MNINLRAVAAWFAVSALVAVSAEAQVVAGWDFSQYRGPGSLTPFANSLPANYSDFDPTSHAGAESGSYGTLHFDGTVGSSSTLTDFVPIAGHRNCDRRPFSPEGCAPPNVDGPVRSNRDKPWRYHLYPSEVSFDELTVQRAEGQLFQNRFGMRASADTSIVFAADLTPAGTTGSLWEVTFGGRMASGGGLAGAELSCDPGCTSIVGIDFSTDGVSYSPVGSVTLTPEDTRFQVPLGGSNAAKGFVRLNLDTSTGSPVIDNVAVGVRFVPEPGAVAGLLSSVGLLGLLARRRV